MGRTGISRLVLLVTLGAVTACASGEDGAAANTELNVIVPNNESSPGVPAPIDIQSVEYTINCAGNSDTFLDNNDSFADEAQINGNLEVDDNRDPEIWQGFMDLPPGACTVQLRARDNDGEVICTGQQPVTIVADTTAQVDIVLLCDVSFQAPVGMLDVDGTFSFIVGNFCPDLFVLNCLDSAPSEVQILPPPNPAIAATQCEVRYRDGDSTCGQSCDPQSCVTTPEGLTCTPGPDPGVSTTVTCTDLFLDCNGDGSPDPSCTWFGDSLGSVGQPPAQFPGPPGQGNFFVSCIPPTPGGTTGGPITCIAVTTDGDLDCDKTKTVEVQCPFVDFCDEPTTNCDDGNDCTVDSCNPSTL
ncbi:MAG: hypothetical protein WCE62_16150, partial [Polyangiales bacterium]